jgi:SAM-dependent methyltransferase
MFQTLDQVQEAVRGFWTARILLSAVELDLLAPLTPGPVTAEEAARACGTDPRATGILLDALASLGLVTREGDRYRASELAARHLSSAANEPVLGMFRHQAELWRRWSRLSDVVRSGRPTPRDDSSPLQHESFILAMHDSKRNQSLEDWIPIDLFGLHSAIDLGGGPGTLAVAIAKACPGATVVLFDRPATLDVAAHVVPGELWGSRVVPRAGDLLEEAPYGEGFDLAILSAVLHSFGEQACAGVVKRAALALRPGGRLLVRETLLDASHAGPPRAALFSVNMLVGTEHGRSYTLDEIAGWMRDAGLEGIERLPGDVVVATRSARG